MAHSQDFRNTEVKPSQGLYLENNSIIYFWNYIEQFSTWQFLVEMLILNSSKTVQSYSKQD